MSRSSHGIPVGTLNKICSLLNNFTEVEEAILFGSRAKDTHQSGSDIDLALVGVALNWIIVGKIYDALDDLLLPYQFSLIHLNNQTDDAVAEHIKRVGASIYKRKPLTTQHT